MTIQILNYRNHPRWVIPRIDNLGGMPCAPNRKGLGCIKQRLQCRNTFPRYGCLRRAGKRCSTLSVDSRIKHHIKVPANECRTSKVDKIRNRRQKGVMRRVLVRHLQRDKAKFVVLKGDLDLQESTLVISLNLCDCKNVSHKYGCSTPLVRNR